MRRWLYTAVFALLVGQASAQEPLMREVFKQLPDSLMPYLTQNDRLDFIDFFDSNMKAEVSNRMGGYSELTALTSDSLSIRMSDALRVDMLLLALDEPIDTIRQVVVVAETFLVDSLYGETALRMYSTDWQPLMAVEIPWNAAQQKRIESLRLQNILKRDEDILNNR